MEIRPGKTFHWEGRYGYDPNLRETIRTDVNVYEGYRPELPESYRAAEIVFLANIDPDLQDGILAQVRRPKLEALDTMNHWIRSKPKAIRRVLKKVDILFANDEEIRMLTDETNLIRAGRKILASGPRLVVTKKGEHGALVFGRRFVFGVLANPCEDVVDPTGAGDSFAGGFLGYLDKNPVGARLPPWIIRSTSDNHVMASSGSPRPLRKRQPTRLRSGTALLPV